MTKPKHSTAAPVAEVPATAADLKPPATDTAIAAATKFRFAIEDNIPLPQKRIITRGESAYPYPVLNIGQSFFVPVTDRMKEPWKTLTSLSSRMSRDLHPKKFTTARDKNAEGVEGVRVWRMEDSTEALKEPKKINRKARKDSVEGKAAEAARLAAEAEAGDTSQRKHPEPDFDTPPPPPAPGAPPPPPPAG